MPTDPITRHVDTLIRQIAYRIEGEPGGEGRFVVPSKSVEGIAWLVDVLSGRRVRCSCIAFQTRNRCRHADATRKAWDAEPRPTLESQLERSLAEERNRKALKEAFGG